MDADQVLAFRLARTRLAGPPPRDLAGAAATPASDFQPGSALLALAARWRALTRERFEEAVEDGELVVAHVVRGAIHAVAPADHALFGRALLARDDDELAAQLGQGVQRLVKDTGIPAGDMLSEVAAATKDALARGRRLDRTELHEAYRGSVREELLPWCRSCKSHHVAPMLWRYATIAAGARLDAERRYRAGKPGRAPAAAEAVRRFLRAYGPARPGEFADWAGVASAHGRRLWDEVAGELDEVRIGTTKAYILREDLAELESPPAAEGVVLLPPGDPYLQKPNRPLLAPDDALRKRLFRPVASPGAVLRDGKLAGLWKVKAKGRTAEVTVEPLGRLRKADLQEQADRVAALRGAEGAALVLG